MSMEFKDVIHWETPSPEEIKKVGKAVDARAKRAEEMKHLKIFYIHRQEFKFKVSYMVLGAKDYVPGGSRMILKCPARSKPEAARWLKECLAGALVLREKR